MRIHWATLQLPPALVEYVLAHELAHLREPHHGPAFWQLLARVMPDYEERKRELASVALGCGSEGCHDRADWYVCRWGSLDQGCAAGQSVRVRRQKFAVKVFR